MQSTLQGHGTLSCDPLYEARGLHHAIPLRADGPSLCNPLYKALDLYHAIPLRAGGPSSCNPLYERKIQKQPKKINSTDFQRHQDFS